MVKKYQTKKYEDYEPISNLGVCSAILLVLASGFYLGAFSSKPADNSNKAKDNPIFQKVSSQSINMRKENSGFREKSE